MKVRSLAFAEFIHKAKVSKNNKISFRVFEA